MHLRLEGAHRPLPTAPEGGRTISDALSLTYQEIADRLGVTLVRSTPVDEADISHGIIYWHDRKVTRPGLRNFLKLYVSITKSHNRGQPEWLKIYEQNIEAFHIAYEQFGIRFGYHLTEHDRARCRKLLTKVSPKPRNVYMWSREITR